MPSLTVLHVHLLLLTGAVAQRPPSASLRGAARDLSISNVSTCNRDTGRYCPQGFCFLSQGPAECTGTGSWFTRTCKCKPGFCADSSGRCVLDTALDVVHGEVFPINAAQPTFPGAHGDIETAICFSGGGSRSLTLVMGQLRALSSLGVMPGVDAISAVSGGSWATSVYMFAKADEKSLLGDVSSPSSLSMSKLKQTPPALGNTIVAGNVLTNAAYKKLHGADWDRLWQLAITELILKPFGLDSQEAFMAVNESAIEAIVQRNPALKKHQFITPVEGRPKVFVMNGLLLNPAGEEGGPNGQAVAFQMSPDYTGSPFYPDGAPVSYKVTKDVTIGGGLVETFTVGNMAPKQQSGGSDIVMPSPKLPFTLGDAIGISSSAFAETCAKLSLDLWKLNPELEYWPVTKPEKKVQEAINFEMGDAGLMDNSGMMAMLQRGARKIVWFVNEYVPLVEQDVFDFCTVAPGKVVDAHGKIGTDVYNKFMPGVDLYNKNTVFAAAELPPYLCELQKLKAAGKPLVLRKTFKVLPNAWWGIVGGYDVDTLLVYNEKCQDFEDLLPQDTKTELAKGTDGDFARFPQYSTEFQNSYTNLVGLTAEQVNLLAAQAEYSVLQNSDVFKAMLSK